MTRHKKHLPGMQGEMATTDVIHSLLAGFLQESDTHELICQACQLRQRDFQAYLRELANLGPVERFW